MPHYIFLIKAHPDLDKTEVEDADPAKMERMTAFNKALKDVAVLVCAQGLKSTKHAFCVDFGAGGANPTITHGPFDVVKDRHVRGFWISKTKDAAEAEH